MPGVFDDVFKRYDVRGLFPQQLNGEIACTIGRAFALHLHCKTVAVGRDHRAGSQQLFNGFCAGLVQQGCNVTDLGLISTDMIYFAVGQYGFDAGCMITASHNPKQFNGFKFVGKGSVGISSETGLLEIKALAEKGCFAKPFSQGFLRPCKPKGLRGLAKLCFARKQKGFSKSGGKGKIAKKDILDDYIKNVLSFVDAKKMLPLRVVVDASNGMASKIINAVEKKLPLHISKLFFELDSAFPNHQPNPLDPAALATLQKKVVAEKADAGALFDGDGDRMFMVDERGEVVNGSELTCLIASDFLRRWPGSKILYTPVMSKVVLETIKANRGIPVLERVGHTFIKTRMRKEKAVFGGELSGHFYFRDNFFADSGLIALLVALEVLSESGKKLSELIAPFRRYYAIDETNSDVSDKDAKMAEIERIYAPKANATSKLDGFSAYFDDWWFNVRASGTENLLRLNLEADSRELMLQKKRELLKIIRG